MLPCYHCWFPPLLAAVAVADPTVAFTELPPSDSDPRLVPLYRRSLEPTWASTTPGQPSFWLNSGCLRQSYVLPYPPTCLLPPALPPPTIAIVRCATEAGFLSSHPGGTSAQCRARLLGPDPDAGHGVTQPIRLGSTYSVQTRLFFTLSGLILIDFGWFEVHGAHILELIDRLNLEYQVFCPGKELEFLWYYFTSLEWW